MISSCCFSLSFYTLNFFFRAKLKEIKAGADGFLVFDPDLVQPLIQVSSLDFTYASNMLSSTAIIPFIMVSFALVRNDLVPAPCFPIGQHQKCEHWSNPI